MNAKTLFAALCVLAATGARADVASTGGAVVEVAPPASVALDAFESNTQIRVFDEQQGVVLGGPLAVNISAPGLYDDPVDLTPAVIPAGTEVSSHLLHFDIIFTGTPLSATGTVTFSDRIIGVIVTDADLDASDGLGAVGTTYPAPGLGSRGLEQEDQLDMLEVGCDTITVSLEALEILDHVRVITAHEEPCHEEPPHEGCTPGYWKQCASDNANLRNRRIAQWLVAGFSPGANLNATFGTSFFPNLTLCQGANQTGGGLRKLARHGVAALLNASHPDVNYSISAAEVIALVQAGDADTLAAFNELDEELDECPLR